MYPYSYYGMPDDPVYQEGMYWVTGPEGEVTNSDGTTGTKFYSNINSDWANKNYGETVYGYSNWSTWKEGEVLRSQPDNNSPFLTVGYGTNNQWDDVSMGGGYAGKEDAWAKGFVQEKNLQHSSLNVQAGNNVVNLQGNIGGSEALDTVNIQTTGNVIFGGAPADVTKYGQGSINADHGVYISGKDITAGGEIITGKDITLDTLSKITDTNAAFQADNVIINAAGNLTVHGIDVEGYSGNPDGGKIKLISTADSGTITFGKGLNNIGETTAGSIKAASTANGAVVIDVQGKKGAFINTTTGDKAIDTKGTWQVYVASPSDYETDLGDNLNSEINAQWSSESTKHSATDDPDKNAAGKDIGIYTDNTHNKFIFQVTPVITISGGYASKTYGDTLPEETMANTLISKATYKDSKKNDIDVTSFKKNFDESHYLEYVISSDSTSVEPLPYI